MSSTPEQSAMVPRRRPRLEESPGDTCPPGSEFPVLIRLPHLDEPLVGKRGREAEPKPAVSLHLGDEYDPPRPLDGLDDRWISTGGKLAIGVCLVALLATVYVVLSGPGQLDETETPLGWEAAPQRLAADPQEIVRSQDDLTDLEPPNEQPTTASSSSPTASLAAKPTKTPVLTEQSAPGSSKVSKESGAARPGPDIFAPQVNTQSSSSGRAASPPPLVAPVEALETDPTSTRYSQTEPSQPRTESSNGAELSRNPHFWINRQETMPPQSDSESNDAPDYSQGYSSGYQPEYPAPYASDDQPYSTAESHATAVEPQVAPYPDTTYPVAGSSNQPANQPHPRYPVAGSSGNDVRGMRERNISPPTRMARPERTQNPWSDSGYRRE